MGADPGLLPMLVQRSAPPEQYTSPRSDGPRRETETALGMQVWLAGPLRLVEAKRTSVMVRTVYVRLGTELPYHPDRAGRSSTVRSAARLNEVPIRIEARTASGNSGSDTRSFSVLFAER